LTDSEITAPADDVLNRIADDLCDQGYSVQPNALAESLVQSLGERCVEQSAHFAAAGLGRGSDFRRQENVRRDKVQWITGDCLVEQQWLNWNELLRQQLNQRLYFGLQSFESHFAHYRSGDFYRRHLDAFRGSNSHNAGRPSRKLSVTLYFNNHWTNDDGGELALYAADEPMDSQTRDNPANRALALVPPQSGTLCLFLSDQFPHEVLPTRCDRYSIAGWFRAG